MYKWVLVVLFAVAMPLLAQANEAAPAADDPALEKRVSALAEELRCLVCQNQSLADSHADLAIDLKNQIREKLRRGQSDKEVVDYLVARYGDFVLYRPPVKATTWLLWFGPALLLVLGLGVLIIKLRQRRRILAQRPQPSVEERQRVAELLTTNEQEEQA
ncbi:MAG TPA: cytochrome c-type biogenesis protein [Novimethylophilus sp.]|jgi:cytochrome c-type biogenesis protein CcmH|uniref:cytochrome c-type biogenesis protein n=1 Tax=Novimethylophilus sp. TaxID=2137426 RepID=UPI002F401493